jgi:transcriptional regulator GlxA family with amidase domain
MVEDDHGEGVARAVAKKLVVYLRHRLVKRILVDGW